MQPGGTERGSIQHCPTRRSSMIWIFPLSGGLAMVLSIVILVLSQRKSTPDRLLNRWAVATAVAWVVTIMVLCVYMIMFINGLADSSALVMSLGVSVFSLRVTQRHQRPSAHPSHGARRGIPALAVGTEGGTHRGSGFGC